MKSKTQIRKDKGYIYYRKGLNSKEIAKLLDVSFRTVQSWMRSNDWKNEVESIDQHQMAYKLHEGGLSYKEISESFNVSESTIYRWVDSIRNFNV